MNFSIRVSAACLVASWFQLLAIAAAQEPPAAPPVFNPSLGPVDDAFIERQTAFFLDEAAAVLKQHPPSPDAPAERLLALHLIDAALHDTHAANRPCVQQFYHESIAQATADIEAARVEKGLRIWRIYNHGFVVRSPSVTIGFDLHRGPQGFRWEAPDSRKRVPCPDFPFADELAQRIAKQCDVLFISHMHDDHVDPVFIQAFLDQGKPVVAPENVLESSPLHEKITHLAREIDTVQQLPLEGGARSLDVVVYPGQQYQGRGLPVNFVLVKTPEGLSVVHNGDEINDPYPQYQVDFEWIDKIHEHHQVDVFLTNCWANDLFRMIRGVDPKLVVLGHQNEVGHPMNDRVPYWGDEKFLSLNFAEAKAAGYPLISPAWGEVYDYVPQER